MGSGKSLNDIEKEQIKTFRDLNLSISEISRRVNCSGQVMSHYLNHPESFGTNVFQEDLKNLLNVRDELSSTRLPRGLAQHENKNKLNLEVSRLTTFRCLQGNGFLKFVKHQHKPFLMEAHKKIWLNWAKEMMDLEENWDSVIFSDYKKLNLDGPDGLMALNIIGMMSDGQKIFFF